MPLDSGAGGGHMNTKNSFSSKLGANPSHQNLQNRSFQSMYMSKDPQQPTH